MTTLEDMVGGIRRRREAIWFEMPDEVARLGAGHVPRGTGSYGQVFTTLLFAEGELRTMTDEVLWSLIQTLESDDVHLPTLKHLMRTLVQYKADFFDFVGLPETARLFKDFLAVCLEADRDGLRLLLGEMLSYGNRLHMWVDFVFPWGVANAFPRQVPESSPPPASVAVGPADPHPLRLDLVVDGERIAEVELFQSKAPQLCAELARRLPIRGLLQHAKLAGQEVFFTVPLVAPWENYVTTDQLQRGAIGFYNPRQQLCIFYGTDLAEEPLGMSYVGQIVSGLDRLEVVGMRTWLRQGGWIELREQ